MKPHVALLAGSAAWLLSSPFGPRILLAPEGAAAGGGDGGAPPAPAAGGEGGAQGAPAAAFRPEGLPDHLYGASDKETVEKLYGAFKGYQDEASKRVVPADPSGYKFTPSDAAKPLLGDDKDPGLQAARAMAHKHGLTDQQFNGFVNDFVGDFAAKHLAEAEKADMVRELDYTRKHFGFGDDRDGKAALAAKLDDLSAFAGGLAEQLNLPPEAKGALEALTDMGAGNVVLDALRNSLAEKGIVIEGKPSIGGAISKAELHKLDSDPRIDPSSSKFDPKVREDYDAAYKRLYANG